MNNLRHCMKEYYSYWGELNFIYDKWARRRGLTMHSLFALTLIEEKQGKCTQKDICENFSLSKQTVNSILKRFEELGYIKFISSEKDARYKYIVFTTEGYSFAHPINLKVYKMEEQAMLCLSEKEREALTITNRKFTDSLKEIFENDR